MKKAVILSLAVISVLFVSIYAAAAFGIQYAIRKVASASPLIPTTSSHIVRNVTYCNPQNLPQKLDLYLPDMTDSSYPLIVYVHGGSWVSGSKDAEALGHYLPALADEGFAVAAINYRLAPAFTFPAQVDDVKCAIRFLRMHAQQYNIEAGRVGIIGESAGGYLSAFSGVTGDNAIYKTSEYDTVSDRVQAVVDISGPSDFTGPAPNGSSVRIVRTFLGNASPADASVLTNIASNAPPFLIMHGRNDTIVPLSQSEKLQAKLSELGIPVKLTVVDNAGHNLSGLSMQPQMSELAAEMLSFLNTNLKH